MKPEGQRRETLKDREEKRGNSEEILTQYESDVRRHIKKVSAEPIPLLSFELIPIILLQWRSSSSCLFLR